MIRRCVTLLASLVVASLASAQTPAACTFTTFTTTQPQTYPKGINRYGNVTGWTGDVDNNFLMSFTRYANGSIKTGTAAFNTPYIGLSNKRNEYGTTVGFYRDASYLEHGYIQYSSGTGKTVDYPGGGHTVLNGVNRYGTIVGAAGSSGSLKGFKLSNGIFTAINFPGAADTEPQAISNTGVIVGAYLPTTTSPYYGFVYANGKYVSVKYPDANNPSMILSDVNASGVMVGSELLNNATQAPQGFIYANSKFYTVRYPGADYTGVTGINGYGVITGSAYFSSTGAVKGFTAKCTY